MNAIFVTQSGNLRVFYKLFLEMKKKVNFGSIGFYVTDIHFYRRFLDEFPEFEQKGFYILKEWDLLHSRNGFDLDLLNGYEQRFASSCLWDVLVGDRRIYYGKKSTFYQDYSPRFTHEQMLSILQMGLVKIEQLIHRVVPDMVLNFQCITFGEYIFYLLSKEKGISFQNMRPVKIHNRVIIDDDIFEPSRRITQSYSQKTWEHIPQDIIDVADTYIEQVRHAHAMYEGVLPPTGLEPQPSSRKEMHKIAQSLLMLLKESVQYYRFQDNACPHPALDMVYRKLMNPLRAKYQEGKLKERYINSEQLPQTSYAFFPLHTEPEVSLMVYSKPILNQIDVVRQLAISLPVGMKLLVKEHPVSIGKRTLSYYKKLLRIPNVILANPKTQTRDYVMHANMLLVLTSSVGLEGLVHKKPVLCLSRCSFEILPETMVRRVRDLFRLSTEIKDLFKEHQHDEAALRRFICASMMESVSIDYYSGMLQRRGVYKGSGREKADDADYQTLVDYILKENDSLCIA